MDLTLTMLPPTEEVAELGADEAAEVMGEMREREEMLEVGVCTEQLLLLPLSLLEAANSVKIPDDASV